MSYMEIRRQRETKRFFIGIVLLMIVISGMLVEYALGSNGIRLFGLRLFNSGSLFLLGIFVFLS